jgi:hypothetical protein
VEKPHDALTGICRRAGRVDAGAMALIARLPVWKNERLSHFVLARRSEKADT